MTIADRLAEFIAGTTFADIPAETVEFTKALTLKCVAGMVAGSVVPTSEKIVAYVRARGGAPEASVIGCGFRTSVEQAALADGYFAHASELEDDQFPGGGISDITVWPALIPAAEHLKLSGKAFLEAAYVGMEVQNRIAYHASAGTDAMGIVGLPFYGAFGATAAAAKAYGLGRAEVKAALGIAMTQGIGYMHDWGTDTHFFESAAVCRNGIIVAQLAKAGMTSNPDFPRWLNMLVGEGKIDFDKITDGLGQPPHYIHNTWVKKYPCCFFTHRHVDALREIMREHGVGARQVARVTIHVGPMDQICNRPEPKDPEDSKFSFQHVLGTVLVEGDIGLEAFAEGRLERPEYAGARAMVNVAVHPEWPRRYQSGVGRVEVALADGRTFAREREQPLGGAKHPLSRDEHVALYRKYTAHVLSPAQVEQSLDVILNLERAGDLQGLMGIVIQPQRGR